MNNFTENTRVQVPAALHLCKLGYTYLDNIIDYEENTNILTDVFISSLNRLNPEITDLECLQLLNKIKQIAKNDDLGREFYNLLSSNSGIKLIDFINPDNNQWHITTEFTCENTETKDNFRPDITCFINGLPLAFIEVKKPNNREGILSERDRINTRMSNKQFRRFFNITQLMIFSNNQEYDNENRVPIQGAFYSCSSNKKAFFNVFRESENDFITKFPYQKLTQKQEDCILKHRNCINIKKLAEYHTNKDISTPTNRILTSMLSKERFLYILRYGIAYVDRIIELEDGSKSTQLEKHIMRYQQLFASLSILKKLDNGVKSGIIWHTQGSGKTTLAYYSVKSLTDYFAKKNTVAKFYFIVDRIALMEQASDEFASRGLIVRTANSRDELMQDLRNTKIVDNDEGKLEIMVVNIQKFKEDSKAINIEAGYNTNLQRIFFIDEAHRGYNPKGSFLANLLEADKNSIKIALTGTPLLKEEKESWRIFGNYIDTYYYDKSIADGYTLKLIREPIETIYKERIENILEELTHNIEVKKKDIDKNKIIEHESYLNSLLDYIIDDFNKFRIAQNDESVGAMIVCKTNSQAREMYRLWQERFQKATYIEEKKEELLLVAESMAHYGKYKSNTKPLKATLILHDEGDKLERKAYIDEYKKQNNIDVLIVNQMLLTGFDAPRLKKLYLGRSLDGHDLLQALTRVNRPYKDFKYGYVVDFVDIKENFNSTNDRYLKELNRTAEGLEIEENPPIGETIIVDKEEILSKIKEIRSELFNYNCENYEEFRKQLDAIDDKQRLYQLKNTLNEAKAIMNQIRILGDDELKAKFNKLPIDALPTLATEVTHKIERLNLLQNTETKTDINAIINLAISELEFEFTKGEAEELKIFVNDIREYCQKVQREFERNFDKTEDKYVILADEFREYFRKKGFIPQSIAEAKKSIEYVNTVMAKIIEINNYNQNLKQKYQEDERFARIHKRIEEENKKREKALISEEGFEIAENLLKIKEEIDEIIFLDINKIYNEDSFKQNVLSIISSKLMDSGITIPLSDRKYLNNLITAEYFI